MNDRSCACGCGDPVGSDRSNAIYAHGACKTRAARRRREMAALAAPDTAETPILKLRPCATRVLRVLKAAGPRGATTRELCQPQVGGVRFGARLYELRAAGLTIDSARERQGSNRYVLREAA